MGHIDVGPVIGKCDNFITNPEDMPQTKSVIIAPIIITVKLKNEPNEGDRFFIVYACNLAKECQFTKCLYSNVKHREDVK